MNSITNIKAAVKTWVVNLLLSGLKALGHEVQAKASDVLQAARGLEIARGNAWKSAASAFKEDLIAEAEIVARVLETAERSGAANDTPEGVKVVILSDTLAKALALRLRTAIGGGTQ